MTSQVRLPAAKAGIDPATACADIDLAAFRSNVAALRRHADVPVMIVVKADGYGHGMLECAREARAAGAEWLGVATPAEALQLREAGDSGPILTWLYGVDEDLAPLVAADVDVSAQSVEQLGRLVAAAAVVERRARVHLKIDTGLSRNGTPGYDWQHVCAVAAEAEQVGAQLTAFVAHPDTVLAMSTLKPTTSNPCWALTRARRRDGQCSVSRCTRRRPSAPTSCGVCRWRSVSS